MAPCTAALFSSAVPSRRLLLANFGRAAPIIVMAKRPLSSSMNTPRGSEPSASYLVPSGRVLTFDTIVHVPMTSCLSDLPCANISLALSTAAVSVRADTAPIINVRNIGILPCLVLNAAMLSGRMTLQNCLMTSSAEQKFSEVLLLADGINAAVHEGTSARSNWQLNSETYTRF